MELLNFTLILFILVASISCSDSLTAKQLRQSEEIITKCMFKTRTSPLAVNRLRKADFSKVDEKSQVSLTFDLMMMNDENCDSFVYLSNF